MKSTILVVDDEPDICHSVKDILEDEGYQVLTAENGGSARRLLREQTPDLILLDIWMPDIDGISLLKEIAGEMRLAVPVVMMSGHGTVETAVEATRLGARDYIEKPLSLAKLLHTVDHVLSAAPAAAPSAPHHYPPPVGRSPQMQQLRDSLDHLAAFDSPVLLQGEPGSGKTFCARYLHGQGRRRSGPFMDVHTHIFSDADAASLLLGEEHAGHAAPGLLERTRGGTLFIADIAELAPDLQESLYAALATGQWVRRHGSELQQLDLRLIAGTRYDPEQAVQSGRLRKDLYQLLAVAPLHIPPLREHAEDVSELLHYVVDQLVEREALPYRTFSVAAQNRLRHYPWPGNIRELEGLVRRLLMVGLEAQIELDEIEAVLASRPAAVAPPSGNFDLPLREAREQFEKAYLEYHLQQAEGSVGRMATQIGVERTHLYRKLRALGIDTRREGK